MGPILDALPTQSDPNLLVGFGSADDGAVYRLPDGSCMIQTVDFFTPIVDDPQSFGAISAANSLSDIYAMGGRPVTALSLVCYPYKTWPIEILSQILLGAANKVKEAGAVVVGGHSVQDSEIKFGLSVTGLVEDGAFWTNNRPTAGHVLVLTKPLGTGVLTTAVKKDLMPETALEKPIVEMMRLNRRAAELAAPLTISAATDITGFGLIGHLYEMVRENGLGAVVDTSQLPLFPGVWDAIDAKAFTGAHRTNREYVESFNIPVTAALEKYGQIVFDPQTSGGLLLALPENEASGLVESLISEGHSAACIGRITEDASIVVQ